MKDESAIVTGGNRGIGRAIALRLAKEGCNVSITGRDEDALKKVQQEIISLGVKCLYFKGNVEDVKHCASVADATIKEFGRIDHLINNAGFGIFSKFIDSTLDEFKSQMDTNLFGVYNFSKAVVPYMIKVKKGNIINIASLAAKNSFVGGTMYSATKHALLGFTKSLMLELREHFIRVATVCPGSVATEFSTDHPQKKGILTADDVADSVYAIIKLPINAMLSDLDIRPTNPGK